MKSIEFKHQLVSQEVIFLKRLIGKDICGIGSDSISIEPSNPELWSFHEWVEISNWNDNGVLRLDYSYDETYSLDDFITLRVKYKERDRKASKAQISFSGKDKFTIDRIETYGYDSEYEVLNLCGNLSKPELSKHEKYIERSQSENIIILYSQDGKSIIVECQYSYLQLLVTLNNKYIEDRLNAKEPKFNAKMILKRKIK